MELKHYYALLRFALGFTQLTEEDEQWLKQVDWTDALQFAQKQSLVGVMFEGIKRLPQHLSPSRHTLFSWIVQVQAIERQSRLLNLATTTVYQRLKQLNVACCILKGQGNALSYQNPLSRTPGDIDVWVTGRFQEGNNTPTEGGKHQVLRELSREELRAVAKALAQGHGNIGHESINHIEMTVDGIAVELHPTPTVLNSPLHNRRLQRWVRHQAEAQSANMVTLPEYKTPVAIPTREFNLIYQLSHLYHHHLFEGIGLRQFVDYALLLKRKEEGEKRREKTQSANTSSLTTVRPHPITSTLKALNLMGFAGAVMYVLQEVFGLTEEEMIVPVDPKRGRLLLADILQGGNFGYYDDSFTHNALGHNLQRIRRDVRLMRYYPAETLSEPFFRIWHYFWRRSQKK